jgi:hypothetical protein
MESRSRGHWDKWRFCRNCPDWPDSESFDIVVFAEFARKLQPCEKCVALLWRASVVERDKLYSRARMKTGRSLP